MDFESFVRDKPQFLSWQEKNNDGGTIFHNIQISWGEDGESYDMYTRPYDEGPMVFKSPRPNVITYVEMVQYLNNELMKLDLIEYVYASETTYEGLALFANKYIPNEYAIL